MFSFWSNAPPLLLTWKALSVCENVLVNQNCGTTVQGAQGARDESTEVQGAKGTKTGNESMVAQGAEFENFVLGAKLSVGSQPEI